MKHVNVLLKASLILVMALGFLKLEAHAVRAQDANPPPAVETAGDSSSSADNNAGGSDAGSSSSADSSGSTGSSAASDDSANPADSSTSTGDEADSPADSSTSADDEASEPADSSTSTGDEADSPADSSTSADDEASEPADSSTSAGDEASNPADSSTSAGDDAANPSDSSASTGDDATSTGDDAADPSDTSPSTSDDASESSDTDASTGDEEAASEAAEILEDAAEKDITLADGDGLPLSAADSETEELLTSTVSDPWFNAGGGVFVGYTSAGSCAGFVTECHTNQSNSIQAAINDSRSSGKVIFIEPGDYSTETFTLNDNTRSFSLPGNVSVSTINLNTNLNLVSIFGGFFSALEVWLNFGGPKTGTLQQGVNLTQSGGTLNVASKTYNETVTVAAGTKDGLQIVGHGNPIQDGTGKFTNGFNVLADGVSISGFTIQNNFRAGINVSNHNHVNADDNKFYRNSVGVRLSNGSTAVLSNNTFGDAADPFKGNGTGVFADGLGGVPPTGYMLTSTGNQFLRNVVGANLSFGATGLFSGDEFRQNFNTGLVVAGSKADVTGSTFASNLLGASVFNSSAFSSNSNTYIDNGVGVVIWGWEDPDDALAPSSNAHTGNVSDVNFFGGGNPTATLVYDNFEGNGVGLKSGNPAGTQVHYSRFYNNALGVVNSSLAGPQADFIDADNNWWGDNQGPSNPGSTLGNVDASDWLALDMSPSDDPIFTGGDTSQLTTQMMSTDGVTRTPLSALDTAGIQGNWFFYSSAPTLQNPSMGTMSGNTFSSGNLTGDALFADTQFDDEIPTTKVTIVEGPTNPNVPTSPGSPDQPGNPGGPAAPALLPLPAAVIPVTGASLVDLMCGSPTQLLLDNDNYVVIPPLEPCTLQASLQPETVETLPAPLPEGVQFLDALTVTVFNGGNALDVLPQEALMQVVFDDAQAQEAGSLAVYWWDGSAWQEVSDSSLGAAASNNTGMFVLVMK